MSEKRQDIQGLRGWAIIMVVLFHFFPKYFPNGYVGVDVFFVISGFLIAMVLLKNDQLNLSVIGMFYYKRIKRILPLYYLVIVSILLAILLLLPPYYEEANVKSSWRAIILISNFKKKNIDQDYKDMLIGAEDLFTHTWSLCVEMQWYLLVPIIFVAQRLLTTWQKTYFTGIALCSIGFYLYEDEMLSFYSVFARIWQFSCGVIAFMAQENVRIRWVTFFKHVFFDGVCIVVFDQLM
ncbi:acyltransferase [Ancylostoma caninum]|uniref:Acyltransferase n=1 Tax=Ancylostoma caninum TaxID=29170 RepID=A0A368GWG8_ANCCA|nr:acyltransferase [Ancylostoma caninum]